MGCNRVSLACADRTDRAIIRNENDSWIPREQFEIRGVTDIEFLAIGELRVNIDTSLAACFVKTQVIGTVLGDVAPGGKQGKREIGFFDVDGGRGPLITFAADDGAEQGQLLQSDKGTSAAPHFLTRNDKCKAVGRPFSEFVGITNRRDDADGFGWGEAGVHREVNVKGLAGVHELAECGTEKGGAV